MAKKKSKQTEQKVKDEVVETATEEVSDQVEAESDADQDAPEEVEKADDLIVFAGDCGSRYGDFNREDGDMVITIKRNKFKYKSDVLETLNKLVQAVKEDRGIE